MKAIKPFQYNIVRPRNEQKYIYYGYGLIIKVHRDIVSIMWMKDKKLRSYDKTYLRNVILMSEIFKK